jgi:hypothetical protein
MTEYKTTVLAAVRFKMMELPPDSDILVQRAKQGIEGAEGKGEECGIR